MVIFLSDGAAALVGSLGLVPSCNVGKSILLNVTVLLRILLVKSIANPIATIRSTPNVRICGPYRNGPSYQRAVDANVIEGAIKTPDLEWFNSFR